MKALWASAVLLASWKCFGATPISYEPAEFLAGLSAEVRASGRYVLESNRATIELIKGEGLKPSGIQGSVALTTLPNSNDGRFLLRFFFEKLTTCIDSQNAKIECIEIAETRLTGRVGINKENEMSDARIETFTLQRKYILPGGPGTISSGS